MLFQYWLYVLDEVKVFGKVRVNAILKSDDKTEKLFID